MENIDKILEGHSTLAKSINKLRSSTRLCISSEKFTKIDSVLKDIGKEFNNCRCLSREEK
jgi:hypothetical protein